MASSAARAWSGATKAAAAGFPIGVAVGLVAGLDLHVSGAAVILAMSTGAVIGFISPLEASVAVVGLVMQDLEPAVELLEGPTGARGDARS